jgi:hypothetical protein
MNLEVDTNVSGEHTASIFRAEDVGSVFLRNIDTHLQIHAVLQARRPTSK